METITPEVLSYQRVGRGLERLTERVAELVYRYPLGKPGFTEEDSAEFLLRFYPRIRTLVARYRDQGNSFETYLNASLRWQLRSFALERSNDRIRLATVTDRGTSGEIVGEPFSADGSTLVPRRPAPSAASCSRQSAPPRRLPGQRPCSLGLQPCGPAGLRLSAGQAQRLMCLTLKSGCAFEPERWRRLERLFGCESGWLESRWHELRALRAQARERNGAARVRRDHAWFRVRCIEARMLETPCMDRAPLAHERDKWQRRLERTRDELRRSSHQPTNLQIATALGIPKGTVDSSLFTLRRELTDPAFRDRVARLFAES